MDFHQNAQYWNRLPEDGKIYCLQARACFFQPGNFRDWGSERVNVASAAQDHLGMEREEEDACDDGDKDFFLQKVNKENKNTIHQKKNNSISNIHHQHQHHQHQHHHEQK